MEEKRESMRLFFVERGMNELNSLVKGVLALERVCAYVKKGPQKVSCETYNG